MMPHKPRWNILLLALFVLFASALIGILISMMMKNFLHYSQESFYYHQANVMERAARELAFALFDQRDSGLNYEFKSQDSDFFANNFECPVLQDNLARQKDEEKEKENWPCPIDFGFTINIEGVKAFTQAISIPAGQSKVIPLFSYEMDKIGSSLRIKHIKNDQYDFDLGDGIQSSQYTENTENTENKKTYLVLSNLNAEPKEVQIKSTNIYPQEQTIITTLGYYQGNKVSRESKLTTKIPEFLSSDNYLHLWGR